MIRPPVVTPAVPADLAEAALGPPEQTLQPPPDDVVDRRLDDPLGWNLKRDIHKVAKWIWHRRPQADVGWEWVPRGRRRLPDPDIRGGRVRRRLGERRHAE